jgi:tetratricopeptide (TPR) repeat protein
MGIVYHAHDRLLGQDVALKLVTANAEALNLQATRSLAGETVDFRLALAQEFKILASLRHPHIISVLDYGFTEIDQPFFTMELLQSPQSLDVAARDLDTRQKIDLVVAMLQALAYLHRRGIVHRDLKPANVLVDVDQTLRVLDFGLSHALDQSQEDEDDMAIVGTLSYMAPETLSGAAISKLSDLYAAGLMAYELFAGFYPFAADDITTLIQQILAVQPDFAPVQDGIDEVIMRLMAKEPKDRYPSAEAAINALLEAADIPQQTTSVEIRESYLQAAAFVGRTEELTQLTQGIKEMQKGQGSAWLIAGESGVGKSRLLSELRTQALMDGALVVRGQAVTEGGAPYQLWRDVMQWLVLITPDVNDEEAGVARELVPEIGRILGRAVAPAPTIAPQQARERLLIIFERLLRRQTQPILILLEDLQWTMESLEVLKHINQIVTELPVMTVGSYRIDESPKLAEQVPHQHLIKLNRLENDEIARLSSGILGDAGNDEQIVNLIQEQTEGNVFFIIEVIRALADDVQSLDEITQRTLPMQVFSGGMQKIIDRRLQRIPQSGRDLLRVAAIYGREFNLDVLKQIAPDTNIDAWLVTVSDAAVIDVEDGTWRFSHDKLREGVLKQLSADDRRDLHRDVALAIEQLYPDDPKYTVPLAMHWRQAQDETKERAYALKAAEQLNTIFAIADAGRYYQRALDLTPKGTPEYLDLLIKLSNTHSLGQYQRARTYLKDAIELAEALDDKRNLAQAYGQLSRMSMLRDGDWATSEAYSQKALSYVRQTEDRAGLSEVLRHVGNLFIYKGQWEEAATYLKESIEHARAVGDVFLEGMAVNSLSDAYAKRNDGDDHDVAIKLSERTRDIGRELGHRRLVMMGVAHIGLVAMHRQDYELAYQQFAEAYELTKQTRDYEQYGKVGNYVGICLYGLHRYDDAKAMFREALSVSIDNDSMPEVIRSLTGIALVWLNEGQVRDALRLLALALNEPRCTSETHALADDIYADLQTQFDTAERNALIASGQALDIDHVAQTLRETLHLPPSV